jgi:hypothetical protein
VGGSEQSSSTGRPVRVREMHWRVRHGCAAWGLVMLWCCSWGYTARLGATPHVRELCTVALRGVR